MISKSRRSFIRLAAGTVGATVATSMLPSSIQAALAIPAHRRHGNLKDVEHVVILMQENRSFDHYFGTLKGVRGFGDRMAIPLPDGQRVWHQKGSKGEILPYHFDTSTTSAQRVDGTPHTWPDAQQAWNEGRMDKWLPAKTERSLGYYKEQDIAFQFAMANAFTICDAYHCSFQGGTNPNRLFLWTGTNDPLGQHGGPVTTNDHDSNGPVEQGYTWTTYPERLQAAGITWRVYQDMADNFSDNPLIGFRQYRAAAPDSPLIVNGLSTWKLDALKRDVLANSLPQVSWIVAPAKYSEHPGPSSPIWGRVHFLGTRRADRQPGSLEQDRAAGDVRRERRLLRPHRPAGRAEPEQGRHAARQDHRRRHPRMAHQGRYPLSQPALRPRPAGADVRDLAVEQGRLG